MWSLFRKAVALLWSLLREAGVCVCGISEFEDAEFHALPGVGPRHEPLRGDLGISGVESCGTPPRHIA